MLLKDDTDVGMTDRSIPGPRSFELLALIRTSGQGPGCHNMPRTIFCTLLVAGSPDLNTRSGLGKAWPFAPLLHAATSSPAASAPDAVQAQLIKDITTANPIHVLLMNSIEIASC
jgi:hypothetical protein